MASPPASPIRRSRRGCGRTPTRRSSARSPAFRPSRSAASCPGATTCSRRRPRRLPELDVAFASVVVVTATIAVTHISDPGCPWAWSAAPHHAVLRWRYGGQLSWRLALIGLAERAEDYTARGSTPESGALGYLNFRRRGMPFDTQPRERTIGTGRACRAIVAARLLDPAAELPAFRALQLARFTTTTLFDTDAGIRDALARVERLDTDAVLAAIDDPATEAAYQADRALVRTAAGSATEFQGKAANTDGAVRYTAPSLIFDHRDGRRRRRDPRRVPVRAHDPRGRRGDGRAPRRTGRPHRRAAPDRSRGERRRAPGDDRRRRALAPGLTASGARLVGQRRDRSATLDTVTRLLPAGAWHDADRAARPPTRRAPIGRRGAADRTRRAGVRRSAAGARAERLDGAAADRPRRRRADRLGQRAAARALLAAVQPRRAVRHGAAGPRRALRAAAAVRILGPRGVAAAGRPAAGAALADGSGGARGLGRHAADPA